MKDEQFNDIFRTKLENFEMDDFPVGGWEQIEAKLPVGNKRFVWFTPMRVAAAILVGVLATASVFYLNNSGSESSSLGVSIAAIDPDTYREKEEALFDVAVPVQEELPSDRPIKEVVKKIDKIYKPQIKSTLTSKTESTKPFQSKAAIAEDKSLQAGVSVAVERETENKNELGKQGQASKRSGYTQSLTPADKTNALSYHSPVKGSAEKKWGFGAGAGAFASQSGSSLGMYTFKNSREADKNLVLMNAASFSNQVPQSEIDHHTPLSVGLSVSRKLNDRFALQSGLTYSYLASTWKTNGVHHTKTKQSLHFIGIPISVMYKITEWNKFLFYTSVGAMCEFNVKGNLRYKYYNNEELLSETNEGIRMSEPYWSVNAKAGVSYPLVRFVSLYVEAGADYYFNNNSDIETIRTEKPTNFDFQFGLRFGF